MKNLFENWNSFLNETRYYDLSSFIPRDNLNPKFWIMDSRLDSSIRNKLLQIAEDFVNSIKINSFDIIDITFTGSSANYNWTEYADVDLHIILDFKQINENPGFVGDFFRTKSRLWNITHDIKIKGHEVEIYVQDLAEPHAATGVYSILLNRWNKKPQRSRPEIDENQVNKKASHISDIIDDVERLYHLKEYQLALETGKKLRNKLRNFRKCGLQREGEFSSENLAFKLLRRNGYLRKLADFLVNSYDKSNSMPPGKRDLEDIIDNL